MVRYKSDKSVADFVSFKSLLSSFCISGTESCSKCSLAEFNNNQSYLFIHYYFITRLLPVGIARLVQECNFK